MIKFFEPALLMFLMTGAIVSGWQLFRGNGSQIKHVWDLPRIGDLRPRGNDVRIGASTEQGWVKIQNKASVYNMDRVFTGKDSKAVVELARKQKITIEPNSLITIDNSDNNLAIEIDHGGFFSLLKKGLQVKIKKNGLISYVEAKSDQTVISLQTENDNSIKIVVHQGEMTVRSSPSSKEVVVPASSAAKLVVPPNFGEFNIDSAETEQTEIDVEVEALLEPLPVPDTEENDFAQVTEFTPNLDLNFNLAKANQQRSIAGKDSNLLLLSPEVSNQSSQFGIDTSELGESDGISSRGSVKSAKVSEKVLESSQLHRESRQVSEQNKNMLQRPDEGEPMGAEKHRDQSITFFSEDSVAPAGENLPKMDFKISPLLRETNTPSFWIWIGSGVSLSIIKQALSGYEPGTVGAIDFPQVFLRTGGLFTDVHGFDLTYSETPGKLTNETGGSAARETYRWKTFFVEYVNRRDQSFHLLNYAGDFEIRYGLQTHEFFTIVPSGDISNSVRSETTLMNAASLGVSGHIRTKQRSRTEIVLRYQYPIYAAAATAGHQYAVKSNFSFDGSIGYVFEFSKNISIGSYWFGQWQDLNFTYTKTNDSYQGRQQLFNSNINIRLGLEF